VGTKKGRRMSRISIWVRAQPKAFEEEQGKEDGKKAWSMVHALTERLVIIERGKSERAYL